MSQKESRNTIHFQVPQVPTPSVRSLPFESFSLTSEICDPINLNRMSASIAYPLSAQPQLLPSMKSRVYNKGSTIAGAGGQVSV